MLNGNIGSVRQAIKTQTSNISVGSGTHTAISTGLRNISFGEDAGNAVDSGSDNVYLGHNAAKMKTGGGNNVIIGSLAFDAADSGEGNNVVIGKGAAGAVNASGTDDNVVIGNMALSTAAGGQNVKRNIIIGSQAVQADVAVGTSRDGDIFAIGYKSLTALTTGLKNMAIGYETMKEHTTGANNIAIGYGAMNETAGTNSSTSSDNMFIGVNSGGGNWADETSAYNIGIGNETLSGALNGANYNFAIGYQAMQVHTTGDRNIAIGYQAMHDTNADAASMASNDNVFLGYSAGGGEWQAGESSHNIGIGSYALDGALQGAVGNVCIGQEAGGAITQGIHNTCIGFQAGDALTTHSKNVAIGSHTLGEAGADYNVAIGYEAGNDCTSDSNTLVGYQAGDSVTTGQQNTGIGAEVAFDIDANNQTCVGYGATTASTGANTIMLGNSSVTDVYMGDDGNAWSQVSDERLKRNIEDWNVGLEAINKLKIKQFQFKEDNVFGFSSDKIRQGIIAQEAIKALPQMVKTNSEGWMTANNEPMTWAMVNAIQELSQQIEDLKKG